MSSVRVPGQVRFVVTALLVSLCCYLGYRSIPFMIIAENWLGDLRLTAMTLPMAPSERIILLTVDEDTLASLPYRSPIDRDLLLRTFKELEKRQVAAVGIDILFDQATEMKKDSDFFATLKNAETPIVVAWAETIDGLSETQAAFLDRTLGDVEHGLALVLKNRFDHIARSVILRRQHKDRLLLGFSAAIATKLGHSIPERFTETVYYRKSTEPNIPAFKNYPIHLLPLLPKEWFSGKIVLIGVDIPAHDHHRTPLSALSGETTPGLLIHAHALAQLIDDIEFTSPGHYGVMTIIFLFSCAGILIASTRQRFLQKLLQAMVLMAVFWTAAFILFRFHNLQLPLISPSVALFLAMAIKTGAQWQHEFRHKRFVLAAFGKYLSTSVIDQLLANPDHLKLAAEKKEMTFLFSDITGFTGLTEQLGPVVLVDLLNDYLAMATDVVLEHEGNIDKIVGDALHVMFNAPVNQADHAERAVRCALALDAACETFRISKNAQGIEFGITRIGINTGEVVVGNFGGDKRFDYTAHGDAINTAARLEGANKFLGTRICVCEYTASRCKNISFRPVGRLLLKGKTKPVTAFEPVYPDDNPWFSEAYSSAYSLLDFDHDRANLAFTELKHQYPHEPLVRLHAERLAEGWTGSTIKLSEK